MATAESPAPPGLLAETLIGFPAADRAELRAARAAVEEMRRPGNRAGRQKG